MTDAVSGRRHSFSLMLPRRAAIHSDSDLKLMLVSLKNTISTCSVYVSKIERELKKRGVVPTILHDPERKTLTESEAEIIGDPKEALNATELALVSTIEVRMDGAKGCILCGLCTDLCPWDAPIIVNRCITVRQERCRGCGVCVAGCPRRAIDMKVFGTEEILDLIRYVLTEDYIVKYPSTVYDTIYEAQLALLNVEKIMTHGALDENLEGMIHTLDRILKRIERMETKIRKGPHAAVVA
ncbi:MAG: 4Fe-4S binding protein [Promethearchaeota archaeon]